MMKNKSLREAVILSAARTPVAKARGALAPVPAEYLGKVAMGAAVERAGIDPASIDHAVMCNVNNLDLKCPGKYISLDLGYPLGITAYNLEHGCGSSLTAAALCSLLVETGNSDMAVAGGVEHSSTAVYMMERPSQAYFPVPPKWCQMKLTPAAYENLNMGQTAERIALQFGVTRKDCDEYSVLSHRRAARAWEAHVFDEQITPVAVPLGKGGETLVARDDTFRPDCSAEQLAGLRPSFQKDGIVTAGNSSPFCDGGAALVLASKEQAVSDGLPMLGRIAEFVTVGVQPQIMGIGPAVAVRKLLSKTGMTLADIDLIELNEAFASQALVCIRELGLDLDKVNVNGGAIALGHPFAATGAILTTKMLYELRRRSLSRGIVCFCIGGGQGIAALVERI